MSAPFVTVEDYALLVRRGQPAGAITVVIHSHAYDGLKNMGRADAVAERVGALVGTVVLLDGQQWVTVRDVEFIGLVPTDTGFAPDREACEKLNEQIEEAGGGELRIVGSFYVDPGMGLAPPCLGISEVHQAIAPGTQLLLLANPSTDQGAFCLWRDGGLVPTGGFYEALSDTAPTAIPWTGDWTQEILSAARWIGAMPAPPAPANGPVGSTRAEAHVNGRSGRVKAKSPPKAARSEPRSESAPHAGPCEQVYGSEGGIDWSSIFNQHSFFGQATPQPPSNAEHHITAPGGEADSGKQADVAAIMPTITLHEDAPAHQVTATRAACEMIEAAHRLAAEGERSKALLTYSRALTLAPIAPLFGAGFSHYQRGEWAQARVLLAEVVRRRPAYARDGHSAGELLSRMERPESPLQRGWIEGALERLQRAVPIDVWDALQAVRLAQLGRRGQISSSRIKIPGL